MLMSKTCLLTKHAYLSFHRILQGNIHMLRNCKYTHNMTSGKNNCSYLQSHTHFIPQFYKI